MDRAPGRRRSYAWISAYFEFLATGVSLDGAPFLENFFNADYGVMSMALNIPGMWQEIMMPGENFSRHTHPSHSANALPPALFNRLGLMGLIAAGRYGGLGNHTNGPRRYILRPHTMNITIEIYRVFIVPHLVPCPNTGPIPRLQKFEWAHDTAQALWSEEIGQAYWDHLLRTERFDRNNPADDAFLRDLPDNIRGWFT